MYLLSVLQSIILFLLSLNDLELNVINDSDLNNCYSDLTEPCSNPQKFYEVFNRRIAQLFIASYEH